MGKWKNMDKKEKTTIGVTILTILVLAVGISYAYFAGVIGKGATTNVDVTSQKTDRLKFIPGDPVSLTATLDNFGEGKGNLVGTTTPSASLTANNTTKTASEKYNVYFTVSKNEYKYSTVDKKPELILTVTDPTGTEVTTITGLTYVTAGGISGFDITENTNPIQIASDYAITADSDTVATVQNWTFKVTFVNLGTDQEVNEGKTFNGQAVLQQEKMPQADFTLAKLGINKSTIKTTTPDFTKVSVSQTYYDTLTESTSPKKSQAVVDTGMYAATDDYGTSYYFRGAVDNNWVKFNNMYWRIVRINGDGSIKLVYSGTTAPTDATKMAMTGTETQINGATYAFNTTYNDNMYVGYKYASGNVHGLTTDSTMKTAIDAWYNTNMTTQTAKLADVAYCNDRSNFTDATGKTPGGGTGTTTTYYGAYVRNVTNKTPSLNCPNKTDAFTVADTTNGNASLKYPVSLLTADEAAMAGSVYGTNNSNYYLYTNSNYWLLSPYNCNGTAWVWYMSPNGNLNDNASNVPYGARPVVSLKSDISVTGTGTWNDPYIVG
jgi:hypothetical protein